MLAVVVLRSYTQLYDASWFVKLLVKDMLTFPPFDTLAAKSL